LTIPHPDDAVSLCSGPAADGAAIDTASVGAKTFTVNATDSHSNSVSQNVNYNVADNICTDLRHFSLEAKGFNRTD
jgi:hypothetical protein